MRPRSFSVDTLQVKPKPAPVSSAAVSAASKRRRRRRRHRQTLLTRSISCAERVEAAADPPPFRAHRVTSHAVDVLSSSESDQGRLLHQDDGDGDDGGDQAMMMVSRWHSLRQMARDSRPRSSRLAGMTRSYLDDALELLEDVVFNYLLSLSILWQILLVGLVALLQPDAFAVHRSLEVDVLLIMWLGQAVQLLIMVLANLDAARRVRRSFVPLGDLLRLYIANSFIFAGLYYACYISNARSFRVDLNTTKDPLSVYIVFLYFSLGTQGTAGYGDVLPLSLPSQSLACVQMMASVIYSVAIFVVGTAHICIQREDYLKRTQQCTSLSQTPNQRRDAFGDSVLDVLERQAPLFRYWGGPVRRMPLLVTMMVLSFNLAIVYMADDDINVATATQVFLAAVVLVTQTFQAMVVLGVSVALVRRIETEEVTSGFLAQSYLSTAVLFSGMYFAIFLVQGPESWNLVDDKVEKNLTLAGMIFHFVYFSITTQTSCGYGDYYPRTNSARLMVCMHLLISMSYTAVVLGLGMSHLVDKMPAKHPRKRRPRPIRPV